MTPALSWDAVFAALAQVCVIAILLERALAIVFEQKLFVERLQGKGIKELLAVIVSFAVCKTWGLDVFGAVLSHPDTHKLGTYLTALTIAGGSKVPATLFTQVWNVQSSAARNGKVP